MKATVLALAVTALACTRAAPVPEPRAPEATKPAPMAFVEVARAEPVSLTRAPTLSLCEAGPPFVCGQSSVLRVQGDRAVRDPTLERGLPHDPSTGELEGTVAQIVGHLPDAAWLRLQRPGFDEDFCEDVYERRGDAWARVGVPQCHSLVHTVTIVARRHDVLFVQALYEDPIRLLALDGTIVGEGTTASHGKGAVVVRDDDSLLIAHSASGLGVHVLEAWPAKLGRAKRHPLPEGVFVRGLDRDLVAFGSHAGAPWAARFDEGRWVAIELAHLRGELAGWGRDAGGTEWAIAGERVMRRAGSGAFEPVEIGPGTPKVLHVQPSGEVWIEVGHEDGARALVRGAAG